MINRVILVGRITKDPELKTTASNVAVVSFTLAVNRQFTDQSGERQADFINCVVWRRQAENLANYVKKGALLGIEGRIQTRNYETETGIRYVTEVVCDSVQFLESKSDNQSSQHTHVSNPTQKEVNDADNDAFYDTSATLAADDDLPF